MIRLQSLDRNLANRFTNCFTNCFTNSLTNRFTNGLTNRFTNFFTNRLVIFLGITVASALLTPSAQAQLIPANDGTGTIVNAVANQFTITKGTTAGQNLFHSFQRFDLPSGTATFAVPAGVQNILTRVTGGNASLIQGQLSVNGANLYFMNPAGVIFGKGATLDVSGAFVTTTANGIGFGNGKWFSATGANNYAELTGTPTQFAFTENQAGSIVQAADAFKSKEGQQIVLIGGTILASKTWETNGGLALATVAGKQLVTLRLPNSLLAMTVQVDPLQLGSSGPNQWTLPIQSLPALLTGPGIQSATDIQSNPDGSITLTAPPLVTPLKLAVQPGDIAIHSLKTPPTAILATPPGNLYDVLIDSQTTFRAFDTIPGAKINAGDEIKIPVSLRTIGKVTIRHGGASFVEAIGYQRDAKGIVLKNEQNRRVLVDGQDPGSLRTKFKFEDDGSTVDLASATLAISPIADPLFNPTTIATNQSYTKGILAIQSNNGNGALLGVLQDSTLPNSGDITVATAVRVLPTEPGPKTDSKPNPTAPTIEVTNLSKIASCSTELQPILTATRSSTAQATVSSSASTDCKPRSIANPSTSGPILKVEPSINESFKTIPQFTPDRPR